MSKKLSILRRRSLPKPCNVGASSNSSGIKRSWFRVELGHTMLFWKNTLHACAFFALC